MTSYRNTSIKHTGSNDNDFGDEKKQFGITSKIKHIQDNKSFTVKQYSFYDLDYENYLTLLGFDLEIIHLDSRYIAIKSVIDNSRADSYGIKAGDVLLTINGTDFSKLNNENNIEQHVQKSNVETILESLNQCLNSMYDIRIEYIYKIINNIILHPNNKVYQQLPVQRVRQQLRDSKPFMDALLEFGFYQTGNKKHLLFNLSKLDKLKAVNNKTLIAAIMTIKQALYNKMDLKITVGRPKTFKSLIFKSYDMEKLSGIYSIVRKRTNGYFAFVHSENTNYHIQQISKNNKKITWALRDISMNENYYIVTTEELNGYPPLNGWQCMLDNHENAAFDLQYKEMICIFPPKPRIIDIQYPPGIIKIYFKCDQKSGKHTEWCNMETWYEVEITQYKYDSNGKTKIPIDIKTFKIKKSPFKCNRLILDEKYHHQFIVRACNPLAVSNSDPIQFTENDLSKQYEFVILKVNRAGISSFNGQYSYKTTTITRYPIFQHCKNKNILMQHNQQELRWELKNKNDIFYYSRNSQKYPPCTGWNWTERGEFPPNIVLLPAFTDKSRFKINKVKFSLSVREKNTLGFNLGFLDLRSKIIIVKSVARKSIAKKYHIKSGDILTKVNNIEWPSLSQIQSFEELYKVMQSIIKSFNSTKTLSLSFARNKQKKFKVIICQNGGSHVVNGRYSIERKEKGSFIFVQNQNTNFKILRKKGESTWVLRETLDDNNHKDYYVNTANDHAEIPPAHSWTPIEPNGKKPIIHLQFEEYKILKPSKPRIARVQAVNNAIQIYFECDEDMRKPRECPFLNVWYEIEMKELQKKK
eukprot:507857_1